MFEWGVRSAGLLGGAIAFYGAVVIEDATAFLAGDSLAGFREHDGLISGAAVVCVKSHSASGEFSDVAF